MSFLTLRDVTSGLRIYEVVAKAKIEQINALSRVIVDFVSFLVSKTLLKWFLILSYCLKHKVFRLDISVNYTALVDLF